MNKQAVIKKENGEYVLYTADGSRVLGRHKTRQGAIKQEYAIQKSKEKRAVYSPPHPVDRLPEHLRDCPVHRWRAETGIELIHREPDVDELKRIMMNWYDMDDDRKAESDIKSNELFGKSNEDHYKDLLPQHEKQAGFQAMVKSAGLQKEASTRWWREARAGNPDVLQLMQVNPGDVPYYESLERMARQGLNR